MRRLILLVAVPVLLDTAVVCALAIPTHPPSSRAPAARSEAVSQRPLPAAPLAAKRYPVFFDWDQATLTPQAAAVLLAAGREAANGRPVRIDLLAAEEAPASSHRIYSQALMQARQHAATGELLRNGVDVSRVRIASNAITVTGPAPGKLALNQ